jgi:hypothetical protein
MEAKAYFKKLKTCLRNDHFGITVSVEICMKLYFYQMGDIQMIVYTLTKDKFPFYGKLRTGVKHEYNTAFVSSFSKSRVYLKVCGDVYGLQCVPLAEIAKQMHFEDEKVYIYDDYKNKIQIGTYVIQ